MSEKRPHPLFFVIFGFNFGAGVWFAFTTPSVWTFAFCGTCLGCLIGASTAPKEPRP